ncbi:MAG: hypothetical protein KKC76_09085 [Proteobacteria bacterium]|nr:hypothetical protein [Pseudomonadota bacterium]MBU4298003.1 hypothetical protein [Pseudomonadota bacterium]MCG2749563.1 hypothetical protein [Desulfobulbaceae bacterium]
MYKLIAAIALSLSLIFLVKESVVALRAGDRLAPPASEGRQAPKPQTAFPAEKNVIFYPPLPAALPDFNKGYLFNEERMIEGATGDDNNGDGTEEDTAGLNVDMDTVFYAGSIIIGEIHKCLVTYPSPKAAPLNKKITARQAAPTARERNYAQLAVGESFSGYTIVEVEPDRIVFQKGSETIEKMLNDPKKTRIAAPPPPKEMPKNPSAATSKTKRVQLGKANVGGSAVQSSRTERSTTRTTPNHTIQVPGIPVPPATE